MRNSHTSSEDWKAAAHFIGDAALADSLAELDEFVPNEIRRVFRADLVVWERFGNDLRHLAYRVDPVPAIPDDALHAAFEQHFPEHPGYARFREEFGSGMLFTLSDFTSTRRFLQSGLWREVYIHLLAKHQLGFSGRIDSGTIFSCGVNRLTGDYGPRDRELARFLHPQLTGLARAITRRDLATRTAGLLADFFSHRDALFACIEPDGRILEISPKARALLTTTTADGMPDPNRVPEACVGLRAALRRTSATGQTASRPFVLVRVGATAEALVLHLERHDRIALVIFQENGSATPATSHRLTRRETEILAWLGEGKSNTDIGTLLGISPKTVGKHCENIFAKLGVENRFAAALLARHASR